MKKHSCTTNFVLLQVASQNIFYKSITVDNNMICIYIKVRQLLDMFILHKTLVMLSIKLTDYRYKT